MLQKRIRMSRVAPAIRRRCGLRCRGQLPARDEAGVRNVEKARVGDGSLRQFLVLSTTPRPGSFLFSRSRGKELGSERSLLWWPEPDRGDLNSRVAGGVGEKEITYT